MSDEGGALAGSALSAGGLEVLVKFTLVVYDEMWPDKRKVLNVTEDREWLERMAAHRNLWEKHSGLRYHSQYAVEPASEADVRWMMAR